MLLPRAVQGDQSNGVAVSRIVFVIIFVITVVLAALGFWVVKNVSGCILVRLRWWNEINEQGESIWRFQCLDQEAVAWGIFGIFSVVRLEVDYLFVAVCFSLAIANIIGFTKCRKDARNKIQGFSSRTIASRFSSTLQSAFSLA
ncbi:Golgi apparatus membrane protein-like protein ECHIDNA [Hibiscus syriacus]|uniref:Golgi apparatus membrane protein TVP23 n=1 Tax=Hibiscus syriacus TaxID=106335 RepID=A0A6A3BMI5_HIBSY|nr:Golgi apparatus membrane protein-like protein ECHIDNA [Hibiscus syriacus]